MNYTIYRNTYPITTCRPEGAQEREIMVKDIVPVTIISDDPIHFQIGDYITVYGEEYTLNSEPASVTKGSNSKYTYELEFQAQWYRLAKWKYRGYNAANVLTEETFELMGTLDDFLTIAVANANRLSTGWLKGDLESNAERKLLTFNGENILTALNNIAGEFNTELQVLNKTIHLKKIVAPSGIELEYMAGIQGGMQRTRLDTGNVFSRLTVYGSEQNIPADYRGGRRKLAIPAPNDFIQGPLWGKDEIEASITFDEVKPERIGTITSVGSQLEFSDTGIDFDLNAPGILFPGLSAKIDFLTGNLAGYQFEIAKGGYNHATRTIKIVPNEQEKANILPDEFRHPSVGDTYSIVDIQMPTIYITNAENLLLTKGTEYFNKESKPKCAYSLPADPFDWDARGIVLTLGNTVHVRAHDLLLDSDVRIIAYSRDLHEPHKYTDIKLSDFATGSPINRIYAEREKTVKALESAKVYDVQRSRNNWKTTSEVATLIETAKAEMLLIVVDGGSYQAQPVINTLTATDFGITVGLIVQNEYLGATNGLWNVTPYTASVSGGAKFVYIRASRSVNSATVVVSDTRIAVESEAGFYHFIVGIISSVIDGTRNFTPLFGRSSVTGQQINAGILMANNGPSNINLDNGTFNFENTLASIKFTDAGVVLSGKIIATTAEFINLFVQNLKTAVTGKRVQITAADNNIQILNSAGQVIIEIDDDSAFEGGPGIRAGVLGAIYSTLGNQGFYSINTGTGKRAYVRPDGIYTDGNLDVGLGAEINGKLEFFGELWSSGLKGLSFTADIMESTDTYRYIYNNGIVTQRTKLT